MHYIPKQDPMQNALEKSKKTTYFKLILPNTENDLKVAIWASGTLTQFLLHVGPAICVCKQMGLGMNFANNEKTVISAELEDRVCTGSQLQKEEE